MGKISRWMSHNWTEATRKQRSGVAHPAQGRAGPSRWEERRDAPSTGMVDAYDRQLTARTPMLTHAELLAVLREALVDPITQEFMLDPVVTTQGTTYERGAITTWLGQRAIDPLTQAPVGAALVPNQLALQLIKRLADDLELPVALESAPAGPSRPLGYERLVAQRQPTLSHFQQLLRSMGQAHREGAGRVYQAVEAGLRGHMGLVACGVGVAIAYLTLPMIARVAALHGSSVPAAAASAPPGTAVLAGLGVATLAAGPSLSEIAHATLFMGVFVGVRGLEAVNLIARSGSLWGAAACVGTSLLTGVTEIFVTAGAMELGMQVVRAQGIDPARLPPGSRLDHMLSGIVVGVNMLLTLCYYAARVRSS